MQIQVGRKYLWGFMPEPSPYLDAHPEFVAEDTFTIQHHIGNLNGRELYRGNLSDGTSYLAFEDELREIQ